MSASLAAGVEALGDVDAAGEWVERGHQVALTTVVGLERSAPRPPGSKLAVNDAGELAGAVSGGCVEGAVLEAADDVLRGGRPRRLRFECGEAGDAGLPCGGAVPGCCGGRPGSGSARSARRTRTRRPCARPSARSTRTGPRACGCSTGTTRSSTSFRCRGG